MFFRTQKSGISLEEMQNHHSLDEAGDGWFDGVCCTKSVDLLRAWIAGSGIDPVRDDEEVVIFTGNHLQEIADGEVAYPTAIVERVSFDEFLNDDRFYDLE